MVDDNFLFFVRVLRSAAVLIFFLHLPCIITVKCCYFIERVKVLRAMWKLPQADALAMLLLKKSFM